MGGGPSQPATAPHTHHASAANTPRGLEALVVATRPNIPAGYPRARRAVTDPATAHRAFDRENLQRNALPRTSSSLTRASES